MKTKKLAGLAALAGALLAPPAHALDLRPDAVMLQGGAGKRHNVEQLSVGLVWDWDWLRQRKTMFSAHTELIASQWRADAIGGGSYSLQQYTLLPVLRLNFGQGSAPWYAELGIGASWLSKDYATPSRSFSTRWNFYDVVGGGYRFGAKDQHELGLRYLHVSNLGIRKPNPGEDFFLLRYALKF